MGRTSIRGKKQSMGTKAIKALKRAENEGLLIVCEINEDYTSKVFYQCLKRTNEQKQVPGAFSGGVMSLWSLLQCSICSHIWDRDYNAASNILYLMFHEYHGLDRPQEFAHQRVAPPPTFSSSTDSNDDTSVDEPTINNNVAPSEELDDDFDSLHL